jgi:hypothetical protein
VPPLELSSAAGAPCPSSPAPLLSPFADPLHPVSLVPMPLFPSMRVHIGDKEQGTRGRARARCEAPRLRSPYWVAADLPHSLPRSPSRLGNAPSTVDDEAKDVVDLAQALLPTHRCCCPFNSLILEKWFKQ